MALAVIGLGTALPAESIDQAAAAELTGRLVCRDDRQARTLRGLFRRSGIDTRHSVLLHPDGVPGADPFDRQDFYPAPAAEEDRGPSTGSRMRVYEATGPGLAREAAKRALAAAGVEGSSVTHLVTASCTGFYAPGVEIDLIKHLGLDRRVARAHVGFMGCHGVLNALGVAEAIVGSRPDARVLVTSVELCTLHFHYAWEAQKLVANALFADGAGALVCVSDEAVESAVRQEERSGGSAAIAEEESGQRGSGQVNGLLRLRATGSLLMPDSEEAMSWRIGDHGFEMTLSPRVPELIREQVPEWLGSWLGEHGLSAGEVGSWAVHPGGPRVLSSFGGAMGLADEDLRASREVLAECGNMSSATLVFILERLLRAGAPRPLVAVGFGPGLVAEALLFH